MNNILKFNPALPVIRNLQWVAKARSKEDARYELTLICIQNDMAIATDGHRMHCCDTQGLFSQDQDGLWEVIKNTNKDFIMSKVETDKKYPEWERAFEPIRPEMKTVNCRGGDKGGLYVMESFWTIAREFEIENESLNYNYLQDLLNDNFTAYLPTDQFKPVQFQNETKFGLIMPFKTITV